MLITAPRVTVAIGAPLLLRMGRHWEQHGTWLRPPTLMSSGTQAARERRWNPPAYAFHGFETDTSQDAIWRELTAGVLPQEIATRSRHPSGTVIVTVEVPPRTRSPTRRKYGHGLPGLREARRLVCCSSGTPTLPNTIR